VSAGWQAALAGWVQQGHSNETLRNCPGIPALMFQVTAKARWKKLNMSGFIAAFNRSCGAPHAGGDRVYSIHAGSAGLFLDNEHARPQLPSRSATFAGQ
jgi:hypothetical protein